MRRGVCLAPNLRPLDWPSGRSQRWKVWRVKVVLDKELIIEMRAVCIGEKVKVANSQSIFHFICMFNTSENGISNSKINPGGTSLSEIASTTQYDAVLIFFLHIDISQSNPNNRGGSRGCNRIMRYGATWLTHRNCGWGASFGTTTTISGHYSSRYRNN